MILIVCNQGCIKYVLNDNTEMSVSSNVYIPNLNLKIADLNSNNMTIHYNVTLPDDQYIVGKYNYVSGQFVYNNNWVEPEPPNLYR